MYYGKSRANLTKNIFDFSRSFKGNCTHDIMKWPVVESTKGQILKLTLGFIKWCLLRLSKKMGLCCRFRWMKCHSAAKRYPEQLWWPCQGGCGETSGYGYWYHCQGEDKYKCIPCPFPLIVPVIIGVMHGYIKTIKMQDSCSPQDDETSPIWWWLPRLWFVWWSLWLGVRCLVVNMIGWKMSSRGCISAHCSPL